MSIVFDGLEDLIKELDKPVSQERLEKTLMRACLLVEGRAKELAPKGKTGDLGRFITSRVEEDKGIVYSPLEYAPYVEYGTGLFAEGGNGRKDVPWAYEDEETGELIWTSGQAPHPFMRPALDNSREEIKQIMREGLLND